MTPPAAAPRPAAESAPGEVPDVVAPVAVVVSRFPLVTETFILREIVELERQGVPVVLLPLHLESTPVVHEAARLFLDRGLAAPVLRPSVLVALMRALAQPDGRFGLTAARLLWSVRGSANLLAGTLYLLPLSAWHAQRLRRLGVRHVHAHFATHPAAAACLISAATGIPWSVTVHAHDLFVRQDGLREKLRSASFVRCISAFNARFAETQAGVPAARCVVIHCGVDPARHEMRHPQPGAPARERPVHVACVAALKTYKGIDHLLEALRILHDEGLAFTCEIAGDGPLRAELTDRAERLGLADRVRFLGALSEDDVARLLATADLFVLPSVIAPDGQMEGIPVALMEALTARLPVIATRLSGIPELVRPGETGLLVDPGDARGLAAAIRDVVNDPVSASERAERGRALVEREFSLRPVVRALAAHLSESGAAVNADPRGAGDAVVLARRAAAAASFGTDTRHVGLLGVRDGTDALTLDLLLPAGHGAPPVRALAKIHRDPPHAVRPAAARARGEHEALVRLREAGCPAPRPLGLDEDAALVVMERLDGRALDIRCASDLRAAGAWLARLREVPAAGPGFTLAEVRARLAAEIAADVERCRARGLPERLLERLATRCDRELDAAFEGARVSWSHGDYWPGNVLVLGLSRVAAVDLEGLRPGLAAEDAASFLEHLALSRRLALLGEPRSAAGAFLEGCGLPPTADRVPVPAALRAAKLLRLAALSPSLDPGSRGLLGRSIMRARLAARMRELAS